MYGRTIIRIGLIFPLTIVILASVLELALYQPGNPHRPQLAFPPILVAYTLVLAWSWYRLSKISSYAQVRTHLLVAPLIFGALMSSSIASYNLFLNARSSGDPLVEAAIIALMFTGVGFAYTALVALLLGLLYTVGIAREYVPNNSFKATAGA
jgi:hypothetical protein